GPGGADEARRGSADRRRDRAGARAADPRGHRRRGRRDREAAQRQAHRGRSAAAGGRLHRRRPAVPGRPARPRRGALMVTGSLARRYARAVVEIGTANGNLDKIGADLASLAKAMHESAELVTALTNPALRRADRRRVLDGLLQRIGAEPQTKNLIYLLLDGERLASVEAIAREVNAM